MVSNFAIKLNLFYFSDEESEDRISKMKEVDNVQKKMLAVSGQDVDADMKEMKEVNTFNFKFTHTIT
jgi:hypothetical protein